MKPAILRNPRVAAFFVMIFSALIFAAPAFAQEEGPETTTTGWIFRWLNFAIVFIAIIWAFSKAGPYFRARSESIQAAVAEGTRAREEAEAKKRDAEARLANLPAEIEALKAQARRDAETDRERIKAMTREEAAKVEHAADVEIAAAERTAVLALNPTPQASPSSAPKCCSASKSPPPRIRLSLAASSSISPATGAPIERNRQSLRRRSRRRSRRTQ